MDGMKAGPLPRDRPHRTRVPQDRVRRQRHRSREPDYPRKPNLPDTPETTCSARDPPPQRSASSDAPANHIARIAQRGVLTQPGPIAVKGRIEIPQCSTFPAVLSFVSKHGRHRAVKRREFITLLGGAAAAWPLAARAQQGERVRRIGVLMNVAADDPEAPARVGAFSQGLGELGLAIGRNVRIDYRWYAGNAEAARKYATELVALAPEVILTSGTLGVTAIQQVNQPVPIVFTLVADPVGAGFVNSLAQPGGNATGFMLYEYSLSGKWLELLK